MNKKLLTMVTLWVVTVSLSGGFPVLGLVGV